MGNWTFGLAGLACLALMAAFCRPMVIVGIRGWWGAVPRPSNHRPAHQPPDGPARPPRSVHSGHSGSQLRSHTCSM